MNKRKIGAQQENVAAAYLQKKGYRILETNYRCRYGELDLIAFKEGVLVIAEVKYRKYGGCGHPAEAVDRHKRRQICKVTLDYIMRHRFYDGKPCRFDVIAIQGNGRITHIEDAFMFEL